MFRKIIDTSNDYLSTVLRLLLGVVFFAHGAQKMLGWFGGYGFSATMGFFAHQGIAAPLAFLAISAEFFGGLGLLFGFLARVAALGVATNMVVAILLVHRHVGFFMNWGSSQKGEGFEFHLLAIALALAIVVKGAGAFSIDWLLTKSKPLSPPRAASV